MLEITTDQPLEQLGNSYGLYIHGLEITTDQPLEQLGTCACQSYLRHFSFGHRCILSFGRCLADTGVS